jgi:hypothetical protein
MSSVRATIETLASASRWTYRNGVESMAEPAAWSAIALAAHGDLVVAARPAEWLAELQARDGSVGISAHETDPYWPTSLALLAWSIVDQCSDKRLFQSQCERAVAWSLADRGKPAPRSPQIGHDTTIVGWSWAANTASWLEPTCLFTLGLTAAGFGRETRVIEGLRLIADRLLPQGGANYGNTLVLRQELLPHVAPTGLALTALAWGHHADDRVAKSLAYLERSIAPDLAPASLSWACIGLAAHGRTPTTAIALIESALTNPAWQPLGAYEMALLLLASAPEVLCPQRNGSR